MAISRLVRRSSPSLLSLSNLVCKLSTLAHSSSSLLLSSTSSTSKICYQSLSVFLSKMTWSKMAWETYPYPCAPHTYTPTGFGYGCTSGRDPYTYGSYPPWSCTCIGPYSYPLPPLWGAHRILLGPPTATSSSTTHPPLQPPHWLGVPYHLPPTHLVWSITLSGAPPMKLHMLLYTQDP